MKKLLSTLFVVIGISASSVSGQTFSIDKDTTIADFVPFSSGIVEPKAKITSTSKDDVVVSWRMAYYAADPGWVYESTCDNTACITDPTIPEGKTTTSSSPFNKDSAAWYLKVSWDATTAAKCTKAIATYEMIPQGGGTTKYVTLIGRM